MPGFRRRPSVPSRVRVWWHAVRTGHRVVVAQYVSPDCVDVLLSCPLCRLPLRLVDAGYFEAFYKHPNEAGWYHVDAMGQPDGLDSRPTVE